MRTPLAWTLRVTISPWNSLPDFLKEPMVAMSFSPWLFEPATIAASMAIGRPQAIDDAPLGAGAQRRMAAERLSWLARNGRSPGEESLAAAIAARRSRLCRPVARSRHQEAARVARRTACQREDVAGMGPCKRRASRAKEQKPWRTEGRSPRSGTRASARLPDTGAVG